MNNNKILKRDSDNDDGSIISLKVGMCLTAKTNDGKVILSKNGGGHPLPYPDFAYIVMEIRHNRIDLVDTSHNNQWNITSEDLSECELVGEFHYCNNQIDCEFINRALSQK